MKKINLGVFFGIIIISFCLLFETGYAATYYVKNSGNDNASGSDDENAWKTIGKINSFDFSEGDVVLFKSGNIFDDKSLQISNVDNFTIAAYGEGEKPLFDGNKIQPITITASINVTIKNIDISGQEWQTGKAPNLQFKNVEGLTIDGVYGNGHTKKNGESEGKNAIEVNNCSGVVEIKNCEIFNWGPYDLPKVTKDFMGIALMYMETGEYKIHNNKVYNVNADCIHLYLNKAKGAVYDNILYNAGEEGIDVKGSENIEVYDNEFYRTAEFLGEGGNRSGGKPSYIVVHVNGEQYSKNNTIRSNSFKDGDCYGIRLSRAEDTNIHDNTFSNVKSVLYIANLVKNTMFHYNIIENPQSRIVARGIDAGCIYENNSHPGTQIYNNTIYNRTGNCKHLISLEFNHQTTISNNIVYQNYSSEDSFGLYHNYTAETAPLIMDNYWYNPNKINRIFDKGKIYTANMQNEWNEKHHNDKFDNPLMNDPEEGDYSLYEKKLEIGAVYGERAELRKIIKDNKEKSNNQQKTTDDAADLTENQTPSSRSH